MVNKKTRERVLKSAVFVRVPKTEGSFKKGNSQRPRGSG